MEDESWLVIIHSLPSMEEKCTIRGKSFAHPTVKKCSVGIQGNKACVGHHHMIVSVELKPILEN